MSSCVSAELRCRGCVLQRVTTRGRDLGCRTMLVFVQRPLSGGWLSQIVPASLHCCTHCGLKGKWTAWSCLWDAPTKVGPLLPTFISGMMKEGRFLLKAVLGILSYVNCGRRGVLVAVFLGGTLRSGRWRLAWGEAPLSVFWQGHYCVCEWSWAERKFHRKRLSERHL